MPYIGAPPASELANLDINGQKLVLDADADTSITSDTDDQIDIEIAGADDFQFTANTFTALSGSTIAIASGATIANSGTATGFGVSLANDGDNRVITGTGSGGLNGEANLTFDGTTLAVAGTVEPSGDTSAGDNAALGYTAALGAILTGQGSTNDVTLVNDADATVLGIPTGTTNIDIVGTAEAAGLSLNDAKLQSVVLEIGNVGGTIKHRWLSPNLGVTELGNWGEKFLNATTTNTTTPSGTNSSTAFANGGKIDSGVAYSFIIDQAAQTSANALISSIIVFNNNTGTTGMLGGWSMENLNVNGTTRWRLQIYLYDEDLAAFNINTTNIASGKYIRILITGWFA